MRKELKDITDDALDYVGHGVWIDIGANDGTLLSYVPPSFHRIGVEPAENLIADLTTKADEVVTDYFGSRELPPADIITSCAMFYDIDDPVAFCEHIAATLKPKGVWINQLAYAPDMVKKNAFDAICHEHLTYYTIETLRRVYALAGLAVVGVTYSAINGGSIRVVATKGGMGKASISEASPDYHAFAKRVEKWRDQFLHIFDHRHMYVYGASTKGNVILQYLKDEIGPHIHGAADRNPSKWGLKTVGTWIPIISEEEARSFAHTMLVLPWSFREEFMKREAEWLAKGNVMVFPLPSIEVCV